MPEGRETTSPSPRRSSGGGLLLPALAVGTAASFFAGLHAHKLVGTAAAVRGGGDPGTRLAQAAEGQVGYAGRPPAGGAPIAARPGAERPEDAAAAYQTFETVYDLVREHYVDPLPGDRKMSYGTVRAMLGQLDDPNCFFLEPEQRALLEDEARGRFSGIGASLFVRKVARAGYMEHKVAIVSVLPGSPAERAGLRAGDIVTHVNGRWVLGADPYLGYNRLIRHAEARGERADEAAVRREEDAARQRVQGGIGLTATQLALRGDKKTLETQKLPKDGLPLTVERPGASAPLRLTVAVDGITEAPPVTARALENGAGYIKVPALTDQTAAEFRDALQSLRAPAGLVLDLRGNAGGAGGSGATAMEAAEAIDSLLTAGGPFALQVGGGGRKTTLRSPSSDAAPRRVVVLVDRGTAAGAEALAASLSDRGVATLAGGRTFGDPYVQSVIRLPDGSGFTLTTGRLVGPNRTDWAATGLVPKVLVAANTPEAEVLGRAVRALKNVRVAARPGTRPAAAH